MIDRCRLAFVLTVLAMSLVIVPTATADPAPPLIVSSAAFPTSSSARLHATIDPGSLPTTYHFEYGPSAAYGVATPEADLGDGSAELETDARVFGLNTGTTYHYRVVASNEDGEVKGSDQTFETSAGFGFLPGSFDGRVFSRDGSADTQAGSHPYEVSTEFALNTTPDPTPGGNLIPDGGQVRDIRVALPPGLIGNPKATPLCTQRQFFASNGQGPACPDNTAVGVVELFINGHVPFQYFPVFNLAPAAGSPAEFGFGKVESLRATMNASLRTGGDYGVTVSLREINQSVALTASRLTFWGTPADPSHDSLRGSCLNAEGFSQGSCPSGVVARPFLTLPTSCEGPQTTTIEADSWDTPGIFASSSFLSHDNETPPNPVGTEGCADLDFSPTIALQPDSHAADTPTGLHVDLHLPQNEDPEALTEADLKAATVILPQGLAVNPSSANGLAACSSSQIGLRSAVGETPITMTPDPATCPDAAEIGTVEVDTPLVDHPLQGSVYLAAQGDNPFGSLLALYIAVDDPQTGTVLKLAGRVTPDPQTGQLSAAFAQNPQLPFEDLKLEFFDGPRAPLRTPTTCGTYTSAARLTPWSGGASVDLEDSFPISAASAGGPCASSPAALPFTPTLIAQSENPIAGRYTPFTLNLTRPDGAQEIRSLNTTLPEGLLAKLAGVGECPDSALSSASAPTHTGALEQSSPSCSANTKVGTVDVAAGAGPTPLHVAGTAYLAGPYKGAPLSLAIITPAIAGPFDLGNVVVRAALQVDPETAQVRVISDPIPTILDGIPLDLRSLTVRIDRPEFTRNPTSCRPAQVLATAISLEGAVAALSNPFNVGACNALAFKPKLSLSLKGPTRRSGLPSLKAVVTYPKGDYANIAKAQITLPHSEFLEQGHIRTVCTRVQFAAGAGNGAECPKGSIYGRAEAISPLLDQPLSGPVYLRSSSHQLPDLVAALHGQIDVDLDGRIDSKDGGIRTTFAQVPDAPVTKFVLEMQGGKKGLLVNSTGLCAKRNRAISHFVGQNGKVYDTNPVLQAQCANKKKGKRPAAHKRSRG